MTNKKLTIFLTLIICSAGFAEQSSTIDPNSMLLVGPGAGYQWAELEPFNFSTQADIVLHKVFGLFPDHICGTQGQINENIFQKFKVLFDFDATPV